VYKIGSESDVEKLIIPQPIAYDPLPTKASSNFSTLSSIAPSTTQKKALPLRPELSLPATESEVTETQKHFFLLVLELHKATEECFAEHLEFIRQQVHSDLAQLEQLNIKKTEELQKYAKTVTDQGTWSWLDSIAKFVYALTLVGSAALLSGGLSSVPVYFLLAAGGLGLLSDKNILESITAHFIKSREVQEKVAGLVSTSFVVLSMGLGLAGGIGTWQCNGLRLLDSAMGVSQTIEKIGIAMGLATAAIKLRESWANKETMLAAAALKLTEGEMFQLRKNLLQHSAESKKIIETMQFITEQTKQAHLAFG
jgi:hypothetical protein